MNVKEAVMAAKNYIQDVFADERISDLGLEEIEFDDKTQCWRVTIGFSRPWNKNALTNMASTQLMAQAGLLRRSYKVVTINNSTSEAVSVKNRELEAAA